MKKNWYKDFFNGVVIDYWSNLNTVEQTLEEANFLSKLFYRKTRPRLLDIPCGNGRHSIELASRGFNMVGIDSSREFINIAQANSSELAKSVEFLTGDMRYLPWSESFDGAFCMGNSFGYFSHEDTLAFLESVSKSLKVGGLFILDTSLVAESLMFNLLEHDWEQVEDIYLLLEHHYDAETSCLQTEYLFMQDGHFETRTSWHQIYTVAEVKRLLERAGLFTRELYGSLLRDPFLLGSSHLLLIAEKKTKL
jgi:SAM-dependent methyltransferase